MDNILQSRTRKAFESIAESGFDRRDGQLEMADEICTALMQKKPLAVEAEVGIGKSFAYLIPALLHFSGERRQIVIATSTIALQEQLCRDIEAVQKLLGTEVPVVLAKGMRNYACRKRIHDKLAKKPESAYLHRLWTDTDHGRQEKTAIQHAVSEEQWEQVCVSHYGCEDCNNCRYQNSCQYQLMRLNIRHGRQIVICNQNMLVAHLLNLGKSALFSPACNTFIIDEAHHIEPLFREAFTESYTQSELISAIRRCIKTPYLAEKQALAEEAICGIKELFSELLGQMKSQKKASDEDIVAFRFEKTAAASAAIMKARRAMRKLEESGIVSIHGALDFLCNATNSFKKNLVWTENPKDIRICVSKKDIRDEISKLLFVRGRTTILTSATIADKQEGTPTEKCAYFLDSIGFPTDGTVGEPKKSPFDYDNNAVLFCSKALPYPNQENREEYRAQSIDEIVKLLNVTHGKTLVLFTAKSDMEYVYKRLSNMGLPYRILVQSSGSSQLHRLECFTNDVNSVILGCGTFWEGINVEGDSLSQVIIFRLPFPVPEPILEYKMSLSKNPIIEVAVPEMILKLKQGAGRLIRSTTDTGIVSILDPRASGKYAKEVRAALPEKNIIGRIEDLSEFRNDVKATGEAA